MDYQKIRKLLFLLPPETAHGLTLTALRWAAQWRLSSGLFGTPPPARPVEVMGLRFPNAVGLAAGLDKNAVCLTGLAALGFGFIEVGTVTPRAQPGNPKPRLFRLPQAEALINRMGFNNRGVEFLLTQVKQQRFDGILGINIGKNFDTPLEQATLDYLSGLRQVYAEADYVAVNISSPNTPGLRQLQQGSELDKMLGALKEEQAKLAQTWGKYVPLAVKIAPDLTPEAVVEIAEQLLAHQIDGVIATNTTVARQAVSHLPHANETGGLSGAPLTTQATAVVAQLSAATGGKLPIIAAGGILTAEQGLAKRQAGAHLVQVYTGLIYQGPALVHELIRALDQV